MGFRKGAEAAAEAAKRSSVAFARAEYFKLEDGQQAIIRMITDRSEWITVDMHQMVPTKAKPAGWDGNWPDKMGPVCRKDQNFEFGECYICDFLVGGKEKVKKATPRTWGLACLREEVIEGGKVVGLRDMTRTVQRKKKDSEEMEEFTEKAIVVLRFGWKNFWASISTLAGHYNTALDRDYIIKREGASTDTTYSFVPLDPITMEDGSRFDLRNEEHMKRYAHDIDLEKVITEQASDEFYARFFDPRMSVGEDGKVVKTGEAPTPKADNDVSEERLAELSKRVKSYASGEDQPAAEPAPGGMRNVE